MQPRLIAFAGDTHVGSLCGLWPVSDLPRNGKYVGIRYLMDCWKQFIASLPPIDILVCMGDVVDGKQPKSGFTGIMTTDMGEQAEAAVEVWKPLAEKAKKIIRVHGTPYHETNDSPLKLFDEALGIDLSQQVVDLDLNGSILNIAHHPAGGMTLYSGTSTDRESLFSIIAAAEGQVPTARWIVRGHKHHYQLQENRMRTIVLAPCWQLQTPHAAKQNYFKYQPTIGGLTMIRDPEHIGGYRFRAKLFEPPKRVVHRPGDL